MLGIFGKYFRFTSSVISDDEEGGVGGGEVVIDQQVEDGDVGVEFVTPLGTTLPSTPDSGRRFMDYESSVSSSALDPTSPHGQFKSSRFAERRGTDQTSSSSKAGGPALGTGDARGQGGRSLFDSTTHDLDGGGRGTIFNHGGGCRSKEEKEFT